MDTKTIKEYARQHGADLIGIASTEHFKNVPPENNPLAIMPECKSVIVIARRILRGSVRGVEEGTNFNSTYGFFGYRTLEENFLSRTAYDLCCYIEQFGFEGTPLFVFNPEGMAKGIPVEPGKPEPNVLVDINVAAQATGLAEIGLGNFLITPEFGTRQRFAIILTDAELEYDKVREKSICSDCGKCAEACPFGAIDLKKTTKIGVKGHQMDVAQVDWSICQKCPNGAMLGPGRGTRPDRIAAACARQCLVQLEKTGKLKNKFENEFRKRTPWSLDIFDKPVKNQPTDNQEGCAKRYD